MICLNYLLMNANAPVLRFSCARDEYGEAIAQEKDWLSTVRPLGYRNLQSFLERRRAPKHRKHIDRLLQEYGCQDLEGFLRVTHAVSLNDTYWVKAEESGQTWADVSLYTNDFDEIVAEAALNGNFSRESFSSTSPEFGTDGRYAKCWKREDTGIWLYKAGSDTYELEPLSEVLASQIAAVLCPKAVRYHLDYNHGRLISKCKLFTTETVGLVKAADVVGDKRTIAELLPWFTSIGGEDEFRRMCILDAVILNTDRHLGNFGVNVWNSDQKVLGMVPVYDNNRSLLFDLDDDQLANPDWYIRRQTPRLGTDFIAAGRGLMTDTIRSDLKNLQGFEFVETDGIHVEGPRLPLLSGIVNRQIKKLLE